MLVELKLTFCCLFLLFLLPPPTTSNGQAKKLELFRLCIAIKGVSTDSVVQKNTNNVTLYSELDRRWNIRPKHVDPLAYFIPSSTNQVKIGVKCARSVGLRVVPKSGGHSAELFSYGSADTIVIAFYNMNKIRINSKERTAIIEPGARLGDIHQELWNNGRFGIPGGICPDVGIGGQALGGGDGYVTSLYGLTLDNILEMKMVDAGSFVHTVNETKNKDLFWGLRGIGSGYIGIVTSFKFKLFDAAAVMSCNVLISYDLSQAAALYQAWQRWIIWINEHSEIACTSHMVLDGTSSMFIVSITLVEDMKRGEPSKRTIFTKMVMQIFPPNNNVSVTFPSYINLDLNPTMAEPNVPIYIKMKSFDIDTIFEPTVFTKLSKISRQIAGLKCYMFFEAYNGFIRKIPETATAFIHRNNLYFLSARAAGPMTDEEIIKANAWLQDFIQEAKFMDSGKTYQNYVDLELKEYMKRYYGVNADRLIKIKAKWDPQNYFRNPQSIPVSI